MRQKPILIGVLLLVALSALGIFYFATTTFISRAFTQLEQRDVQQNSSRAVDALTNRINQLQFKATDWSNWDDAYAFVEDHNAAFIKSNLQNTSLQNLGINFMLFYNEHQKLVHAKGINVETDEDVAIPTALTSAFVPGSKLLATDENSITKGFFNIPGNTVQFVSMPILTSDAKGPMHGTLVFALYLSPSETAELSSITHLSIGYWRLDDLSRPNDLIAAVGTPTQPVSAVKVISNDSVIGYKTINDVFGHPMLVARVAQPRDIHAVASSALRQFVGTIAVDTLGALALAIIFMLALRGKDNIISLKNEFFSMASHELRTPLSIIRNYNEELQFEFGKKLNDAKFDEMTHVIQTVSDQMIELVNTYLDAARLERGKIPFEMVPFSLLQLANTILPEMQATAQAKHLTVTLDCPTDLPLVGGDKVRVQQVLLNLFSNAQKFTETGGVTIRMRVVGAYVVSYVIDTGRGMTKPEQRLLFHRFQQTRQKDATKGSGLGLFISKRLIEQMGGVIKLESSTVGVGTTLSFSLPLATGSVGAATPVGTVTASTSTTSPVAVWSPAVTAAAPPPVVPIPPAVTTAAVVTPSPIAPIPPLPQPATVAIVIDPPVVPTPPLPGAPGVIYHPTNSAATDRLSN